jgi:diguanylate cyclase (GGDEF)-like protein/PAS domain S-box-containing protein
LRRPSSLQILVVEDEAIVNKLIQSQLQRLGYQIAGVSFNAVSAIEMARELKPGLIIMDLHMTNPESGDEDPEAGIKATMAIQKICPTPVIMLTAYENPPLIQRAVEAGVGAYLIKPVQDSELERAIITSLSRFDDLLALRKVNSELNRANLNLIAEVTARIKAEDAAQQRARQMSLLYETSLALSSQIELEDLLSTIVERATALIASSNAALYLLDDDNRKLNLVVTCNYPEMSNNPDLIIGEKIAGRVAITGEEYAVENFPAHDLPQIEPLEIHRVLSTPLKVGGRILGVINVGDTRNSGAFSEEEIRLVQLFADQTAIMIDNARLYASVIREKNFRKAIEESIMSGISVIDQSGEITYINPSFCHMIGYSSKEMLGNKIPFPYWPPEECENLTAIYTSAMEDDFPEAGVEIRLMRKNGERFDALLLLSPMRDNKGQITGWLTAITDTSALKQAQQQLRTSEEVYRTLAENFPNGIVSLFDRDLRCTLMEGDGLNLLRGENVDLEGKTLPEMFPSETETVRTLERSILDAFHGTRKSMEIALLGRTFNFFFIPVRSVDGLIEKVMVMSQDVTVQNESRARLIASEARYRAIVQDQTDLICRVLPEGEITFVNDAFCQYYNFNVNELIGKSVHPFLPLSKQSTGGSIAVQLTPDSPVTRLEQSQKHTDGRIRWQQWSIHALFLEDGSLGELQAVGHDITDRKLREEELIDLGMHDKLTGLFNQNYFKAEMDRLETSQSYPVSIILGDVDGLKITNDTLGHAAGDEMLRQTAAIFKSAFRPEDVVARIGGDEFSVLLPHTNEKLVNEILKRVRGLLDSRNQENQLKPEKKRGVDINVSLGSATSHDGQSLKEVLELADKAMYLEKAQRGGRGTGPLLENRTAIDG